MKKYFFFVVEGQHDLATLVRYFTLKKYKHLKKIEEVDNLWRKLIPTKFPYNGDLLKRVPLPTFLEDNQTEKSVAIMVADSDSKIVKTLNMLQNIEYDRLEGISILCDADNKIAEQKIISLREELKSNLDMPDDFINKINWSDFPFSYIDNFKFTAFVFPNNEESGTLENILLEGASHNYKKLHQLANDYLKNVSESSLPYVTEKHFQNSATKNKMLLGIMANLLKPGKSNQVSIQDNDWLTTTTLKVGSQSKLDCYLNRLLNN